MLPDENEIPGIKVDFLPYAEMGRDVLIRHLGHKTSDPPPRPIPK
ncbi:hypothetical protein AAC03nite_02060 [Alicyclobacillus acidoterrestris]|nr:hypothetical protein AAC03nite_02060 [Alicyclobacillus acidoterrestris]